MTMADAGRTIVAPQPLEDSREFWAGTERGELLVKHCEACGKAHHYPRARCPHCFSDQTVWRKASGRGTVYSWTVMRRAPEPYALAYVELEEGPRMLTNLVGFDLDRIVIGDRVEVVFEPTRDGPPVPMFRPAETE